MSNGDKDKRWKEFLEWQTEKIREEEKNEYEIELLRENEEHLQKIIFKAIMCIERGNHTDGDLLRILKGEDE